jgi:hypothetical protein
MLHQRLRRYAIHLLLACMLFSQYAGMAHVITHLASDLTASEQSGKSASGNDDLPSDAHCLQCLSFDALCSGPPSLPPTVPNVQRVARAVHETPRIAPLRRTTLAFDSRAPPAFS